MPAARRPQRAPQSRAPPAARRAQAQRSPAALQGVQGPGEEAVVAQQLVGRPGVPGGVLENLQNPALRTRNTQLLLGGKPRPGHPRNRRKTQARCRLRPSPQAAARAHTAGRTGGATPADPPPGGPHEQGRSDRHRLPHPAFSPGWEKCGPTSCPAADVGSPFRPHDRGLRFLAATKQKPATPTRLQVHLSTRGSTHLGTPGRPWRLGLPLELLVGTVYGQSPAAVRPAAEAPTGAPASPAVCSSGQRTGSGRLQGSRLNPGCLWGAVSLGSAGSQAHGCRRA